MPKGHDDDFQGSYFALEIDGLKVGWFTACSGISIEFNVATFKENNGKQTITRKRPGATKYSEVVLKRGFTPDKTLHDWFKEVFDAGGKTNYKTAAIVVYDRIQQEVARFSLVNCWPSKLSASDLNASSDEVMVEELTLQHELINWN